MRSPFFAWTTWSPLFLTSLLVVGCNKGVQTVDSSLQTPLATSRDLASTSNLATTAVGDVITATDGINGGALTVTAAGTNQDLTLSGSGTGRVLLKAKVGINTATPGSELDVNGTLRLTSLCDRAGANCVTPAGLAAAGSALSAASLATVTAKGASTDSTLTLNGGLTSGGEIVGTMTSGSGQARWVGGGYGLIERNDGANFYMLMTDSGSPRAGWNALRPFTLNMANGNITMGQSVSIGGTVWSGGAITAPSFVGVHNGNVNGNLNGTATNATNATNAVNATNATNATNAVNAQNATNASNANYANSAGSLNSGGDNVATSGWYRSNGNVGWFNNTHGGGIWMTDSGWIRTYGSKNFYVQGGNMAVDGRVGIGTTDPGASLHVVGNGYFTQNVTAPTFTMNSDSRLKKHIEPLSNQLQKILDLKPVHFYWNDLAAERGIKDESQQVGFLAQQVETLYPEAVRTQKDSFKSVNYAGLIAPVVQALKEFYAEYTEDKNKTAELLRQKDAQIADLQKRLERIESQLGSQPQLRAPAGQ